MIDLENQDHTVALVLPFDSTLDEDTDQAGLANLFASSPELFVCVEKFVALGLTEKIDKNLHNEALKALRKARGL